MFVKNAWYVAAWSSELSGKPISRKLLGKTVVLFRTESGKLAALEDRCIHRGMPLAPGDIVGESIRCPYHGLEFDPSGACTLIPGQENIPQQARVRSYPVVERDQIVWFWPGDPAKADSSKIVPYPFHNPGSGWAWKATRSPVKCNWELINDNLLDLTHLAIVHKTMIGGDNALHFNTKTEVERIDGGLRTRRWMPDSNPPPAYLRSVPFSGKVDRWQELEAWPGVLLAYTGGIEAGRNALEGERKGGFQIRVFNGVTPETETTTHYFWSKAHNFQIDDPAMTEKQFQQTMTIFGEDIAVLELQQERLDEDRQQGLVDIRADLANVLMRRLIRQLRDAEAAPA